jgi:hypothetical protein
MSQGLVFKILHIHVPNDGWQRASHIHANFLLDEFILHGKICCSQTSLKQFHDGFNLQEFLRCVTGTELMSNDMQGFADW